VGFVVGKAALSFRKITIRPAQSVAEENDGKIIQQGES
jgi:hypothetical protein